MDYGQDPRVTSDFRIFAGLIWRHLQLPTPTPVQRDICHFLQHGPDRLGVLAFRGVGKSWLTAAYVLWRLYCNPQTKVLVVSASKNKADEFSAFVKRLIAEVDFLKFLMAREGQRDSMIMFDVGPSQPDIAPSVKSVGITGQVTGSRADVIVADDLEIPNNSMTQVMRERLWEAVKEFDAVIKPGGQILYLGTPQTAMSLYNELPNRGYEFRVWPILVPNPVDFKDGWVGYKKLLAPMATVGTPGDSLEPSRFDLIDIAKRKLSYGRSGFQLQFMLDTSLSDANRYPLKVSDLIVYSMDQKEAPLTMVWAAEPDLIKEELPNVALPGDKFFGPMRRSDDTAPYQGTVMFIDPSGRGRDETGYAVVSMLHGLLFVRECKGLEGGYDTDTLTALSQAAKRHEVNYILIEDNFGDGMFTELLKPVLRKHHDVTCENIKHHNQKELRVIDSLEPVMNQHRLVVDARVIQDDYEQQNASQGIEKSREFMLIHQMTRITRERGSLMHDDRLEALAGAVRYWVEQMAVDQETEAKSQKDRWLDQELDKFVQNARTAGQLRGLEPTHQGTFGDPIGGGARLV